MIRHIQKIESRLLLVAKTTPRYKLSGGALSDVKIWVTYAAKQAIDQVQSKRENPENMHLQK